jgi:tripartite-type tricarboxylate transporter receptor subunit TctC
LLPNVPTVAEAAVPGFYAALWGGVLAPGRTPKAVVARINADIRQVMSQPEVRDKMAKLGTDVVTSSPEAFDQFIRAELGKWSGVAKQAGVKGE